MARLTIKSLDDYIEDIRTQLQDSTITEVYELTYTVSTTQYTLPGYKTANPRILEIVSIEGVGYGGDYVTESDLADPTDYSLWDGYTSVTKVEPGYGASSKQQVYTGINIATLTFQDNSSVFITYRWQNPDFRPLLTNFAGTSRLRMFLSSIATNLQQYLVPIADTVNSFGIDASGDDLKRLLGFVGEDERVAVATTGRVEIANSSGDPFNINTTMRFTAISAGAFILFKSVTGSGTIADGDTGVHSVIAVEAGTSGNVGSYSITKIFSDDTLGTELTTSTLTVTNPPVIVVAEQQETNYFDNGTEEESDPEIRRRIDLAFKTLNTSSYSTVEQAALSIATVEDVVVYDGDLRKGVLADQFEIWASPTSGVPFSPSAIAQIKAAVDVVKPVSIKSIIKQVPHTYLTFDMTIYTDVATLTDTSTLNTLLTTSMTSYINGRQIGEDVLPSTMLSLAKANTLVQDVEMTEVTLTEFVSELNATSSEINIYNTASNITEIYIKINFNSIQKTDNMTYTTDAWYDTVSDIIDERIDPSVKKAILGHDNKYRSDPREGGDSGEYFGIVSGFTITFTGLNTGQEIFVDWNAFDNVTLHGIRLWLKATEADSIDTEIYEVTAGNDPEGAGWLIVANTSETTALTGDGVAQLYEIPFSTTPAAFTPDTKDYWIYIKHNGTPAGVITMPVDAYTENDPQLWGDGDVEDGQTLPDTTFTRQYLRAIYETYTKFTGVNSYQKVIIPSASYEPEKPRFRSLALTFTAYTEE